MKSPDTLNGCYRWFIEAAYLLMLWALYAHPYGVMMRLWSSEDFSYCCLVPPITAYLLWQLRRELRLVPRVPCWGGMLLILPAVLLYWLGELACEFYTLFFSSWLLVAGLCLLHLGKQRLKLITFPLCFSLAMFPLPTVVYSNLSMQLKLLSSKLGAMLVAWTGMEVYREGNVIDLSFTRLQVIDACSGLRYLIPLLIMGILLAHFARLPFWQSALLAGSSIPLTIVTNSMRIAITGLLYPLWGAQVAEGFFHDFSGWLIFMVGLLLLLGEIWLLRRLSPERRSVIGRPAPRQATWRPDPWPGLSRLSLHQFSLVAVLLLISLAFSQSWQLREKVPMATPLIQFPLDLGTWRGTRSSMAASYQDALKLSDYLLADYQDQDGNLISLYIAYHDSQRKGEATHSPGSCLPGSGWVFEEARGVRLTPASLPGGGVEVTRALMQKGGDRMLVYYWFPQRGRILTNMLQLKLYLFWDALTRRRTDGAMVRLITPVAAAEGPDQAEARLSSFSRQILPLLPKFIPN